MGEDWHMDKRTWCCANDPDAKVHARGTIARTEFREILKMIGATTSARIVASNTGSVATSALRSWSHSIARTRLTIGRVGPSTRKHIAVTRLAWRATGTIATKI